MALVGAGNSVAPARPDVINLRAKDEVDLARPAAMAASASPSTPDGRAAGFGQTMPSGLWQQLLKRTGQLLQNQPIGQLATALRHGGMQEGSEGGPELKPACMVHGRKAMGK